MNGKPIYQAVFEIKAAWRRDYSWGALFNEQWRDTRQGVAWKSAQVANGEFDCAAAAGSNNPAVSGIQCFEGSSNLIESAKEYAK